MSDSKPLFCIDNKCTCLNNQFPFCVGKRDTNVIMDGEEHNNTHSFCVYSIYKGCIRHLLNDADMFFITMCLLSELIKTQDIDLKWLLDEDIVLDGFIVKKAGYV